MKECVNGVVAFGLNGLEFCTFAVVSLVCFGIALIRYLNKGIGEKREERCGTDIY